MQVVNLDSLPADVLRLMFFNFDWTISVHLQCICKRLYTILNPLWMRRSALESDVKYWCDKYKSNFDNYLCAKVRFLYYQHKTLINLTFDKLPNAKPYRIYFSDFIDAKIPKGRSIVTKTFDEWTGINVIWAINDYERRVKGKPAPFKLEKGKRLNIREIRAMLKLYYSDVIKAREQAVDVRNEIVKIGKNLAFKLRKILKDNKNSDGWQCPDKKHPAEDPYKDYTDDEKRQIKREKGMLLSFGVPYFYLSIVYNNSKLESSDFTNFNDMVGEEFK